MSGLSEPAMRLLPVAGCAAAMSVVFFAAVRRAASGYVLLLLGVVPSALVYAANPLHRVYSFHGFLHLSIVYRILCGSLPPEDPLFAGRPLLYPWGYHLTAAGLSRALDLSPAWVFALINLCSLLCCLVFLYRTAQRVTGDKETAVFAVLLSVYGLSFTSTAHLIGPVQRYLGIFLEFRGLPPSTYFTELQADGTGLAFYALFLLSLTGSLMSPRFSLGDVMLVLALIGAGIFYPFYFVAALGSGLHAAALALALRQISLRKAAIVCGLLVFAAIVVLPYLLALVAEKAPAGSIALVSSPAYAIGKLRLYLMHVAVFVSLMLIERGALLASWRARRIESGIILAAFVAASLLYLLTRAPLADEFKFLTIAVVALGVLGAPAVRELHDAHPRIAACVITLFLVPFASHLVLTGFETWTVTEPFTEQGTQIRATDPDQEALYSWIRNRAPCDAVFIDTRRAIAVFGERVLYVGLDDGERAPHDAEHPRGMDGWKISARDVLTFIEAHPESEIARRSGLARAFYGASDDPVDASVLADIGRDIGDRPLHVVTRDAHSRAKLDRDPRFRAVFVVGALGVHRLQPAVQALH